MKPKFKIGDMVTTPSGEFGSFLIKEIISYEKAKTFKYELKGFSKGFAEETLRLCLQPQEIVYEAWESPGGQLEMAKADSESANYKKNNEWTRVPELDKKIVK